MTVDDTLREDAKFLITVLVLKSSSRLLKPLKESYNNLGRVYHSFVLIMVCEYLL